MPIKDNTCQVLGKSNHLHSCYNSNACLHKDDQMISILLGANASGLLLSSINLLLLVLIYLLNKFVHKFPLVRIIKYNIYGCFFVAFFFA